MISFCSFLITASCVYAGAAVASGRQVRSNFLQRDHGFLTSLLSDGFFADSTFASQAASLPKDTCKELCEKYSSKDTYRRECETHCRVRTDVTGGSGGRAAVRKFAADHSPRTQQAYRNMYNDSPVEKCEPKVLPDHLVIGLEEVDTNSDGVVTKEEVLTFSHSLCIPDSLEMEIFARSDTNQDGLLDAEEWRVVGEDTVLEYEVERFVQEAEGKGASELSSFDELDANGDGVLDDSEVFNGFYTELLSHYANETEAARDHIEEVFWDHADEIMPSMDLNGDGAVSREEYEATHGRSAEEHQEAEETSDEDQSSPVDDLAPVTNLASSDGHHELYDFKLRGVTQGDSDGKGKAAQSAEDEWHARVEEAWEEVVASDALDQANYALERALR